MERLREWFYKWAGLVFLNWILFCILVEMNGSRPNPTRLTFMIVSLLFFGYKEYKFWFPDENEDN